MRIPGALARAIQDVEGISASQPASWVQKKMTSGAKEHAPPTGCVYRIYNHMRAHIYRT